MSEWDYGQIRDSLRVSYDAGAQRRDRQDKQPWKLAEREAFAARLRAAGPQRARSPAARLRAVCPHPAGPVRLLEIGAGTGQDSAYFAGCGFEVVATDASAQMVARCAAKGLDARQMDFSALGFPDASFDAVHAMNCLLHVPNAELPLVLAEIARVLRPGGLFFLGVYGGRAEEGPMTRDDHIPVRFFSFRTDEQLVGYASQRFEVLDFHRVPIGDGDVFQSLTLRRPE